MFIRNSKGLVHLHVIIPIIAVLLVGTIGAWVWSSSNAGAFRDGLASAIYPSSGYECYTRNQYVNSNSDGKGDDAKDKACIRTIQDTLNVWKLGENYNRSYPWVKVDGWFGTGTANAVKQYQNAYIGYVKVADGIVGNKTWCSMYAMLRQQNGCPFEGATSGTTANVGSSTTQSTVKYQCVVAYGPQGGSFLGGSSSQNTQYAKAGTYFTARASMKNTGAASWPTTSRPTARIVDGRGTTISTFASNTSFGNMIPGSTLTFDFSMRAPSAKGLYKIIFEITPSNSGVPCTMPFQST